MTTSDFDAQKRGLEAIRPRSHAERTEIQKFLRLNCDGRERFAENAAELSAKLQFALIEMASEEIHKDSYDNFRTLVNFSVACADAWAAEP